MRVPANLVEKILAVADAEMVAQGARDDNAKNAAEHERLVVALRRAQELAGKKHHRMVVRGRKSGKPQIVVATNAQKAENAALYILCLVPTACQRALQYEAPTEWSDDGQHRVTRRRRFDSHIVPSYTEHWIRSDRLEKAA